MTTMLHTFVQSNTSVTSINQKYLESRHTQMEVDSVHSVIEQAKKGTEVFIPRDWINIIRQAKKTNPFLVTLLTHDDFKDAKMLCSRLEVQLVAAGKKNDWRQVRWIRVTKGSNKIQFKLTGDWMTIDINFSKKKRRHNKVEQDKPLEPQYVSIPSCYSERLPISACKHKDLLDLCKDGIIPAESIPTVLSF